MVWTLSEGFEKQTSGSWDDYMWNKMIDYGFTHEAFIPGLTAYRISQGGEKTQAIGSVLAPAAVGFAITAWATGQAYTSLSASVFTAITGATVSEIALLAAPVVVAVAGTTAFVEFHKKYEPTEPTHQPSYWNSIAAALGGTFGGINLG